MNTGEPPPEPSAPESAAHDTIAGSGLAEHLPTLLRQAQVEMVELDVMRRRPSFQGGEVSRLAQSITKTARDEHRSRGFGFWEFVLSEAVSTEPATRTALLEAALRHNSDAAIRLRLAREEFIEQLSAGDYDNLPPRDLVSISSRVEVASEPQSLHLPMLDLGVRTGPDGEASAIAALRALKLRGLLFMSGRSYHFYGSDLVSAPDLTVILGRAQLLSPIIDSRWVSHQLIDGRCGLRISTDSEKTPDPPTFVAFVGTKK